jgi:hypothetical protein
MLSNFISLLSSKGKSDIFMRGEVWFLTSFTALELPRFLSSKPLINHPNPSQLNHCMSKAPLAPVTKQVTNVKAYRFTGYVRDVMRSVIQRYPFTNRTSMEDAVCEDLSLLRCYDVSWVNNYPVSKNRSAKESKNSALPRLLGPEDEDPTILRSVSNYFLSDKA